MSVRRWSLFGEYFMSVRHAYAKFRDAQRSKGLTSAFIFAVLLAAAGAAFSLLPYDAGAKLAVVLLALFAISGICGLFLIAAGFLALPARSREDWAGNAICGASSDGLIVTGLGGKIFYANAAYLTLSQASGLSDVRPVERLFAKSPEIAEAIYRLTQAARESRSATEEIQASRLLSSKSEARWYRIKVEPLVSPSVARASLWSVADVSAERERREVVQKLQQVVDFLDQAPAGFFSLSPGGDISYMNATLAGWLGCERGEAGNLKLAEFIAGDCAAFIASASRGASEAGEEQFDTKLISRGKQSLPVRLVHRVSLGQGGLRSESRILVLKRGTGEQGLADLRAEHLRAEQGPPAGSLASLPVAVAAVERSGQILRWNAAFARLMPKALKSADPAAHSIFSGVLNKDHAAVEAALGASFRFSLDIPPVDVGVAGKRNSSARLFFAAANGQAGNGAAVYAFDTTEQRALQDDFAQPNKMQAIGQLAGGVAHDFNNVLTAILGHCDLLLANHRPTDPSFQDINQIKQNANRAAALVRQLLAFSRRQTLRPQVLQLGDVLSDLREMMKRLVGEKITLELRHGRDLWLVMADLNQFEQVLINLIVNSRDAMPEGGKIALRTRNVPAADCGAFNEPSLARNDYVAIEVEDCGHGIPPEAKDKVFEPFFTTKEVGKGTGLGLATVYGIVKQTGGYVFFSSAVGKGTIFTILLPRHIAEEVVLPQPALPVAAPAADFTGHGTILLVEDEEAVRAFAARALASRGYTVLQAGSGLEALEIVEEQGGKIDLVVSDVMMPEMDGPRMVSELRKRGVAAKVIFMSGYTEDAFAHLPEGENFSFLPKPFSLKQLIEAVKGKR
jgi:two-component system, cell cycle sensor histidine kinase and response regulator CckA